MRTSIEPEFLIKTLLYQFVVPDEYLLKIGQEQNAWTESPTTWKEQPTVASSTKFFASDVEAFTSVLVNIKLEDDKVKKKSESTHEKKL